MKEISRDKARQSDTSEILAALDDSGIAVWPGHLSRKHESAIEREVKQYDYTHVDEELNGVRQQFDLHRAVLEKSTLLPSTYAQGVTCQWIGNKLRPFAYVNDVSIQRYLPGHYGIDWHRDFKRDWYLVFVLSIGASALLEVELDNGDLVERQIEHGDLMIMRATNWNVGIDNRPRHRVHPPIDSARYSLAFRYNPRFERGRYAPTD